MFACIFPWKATAVLQMCISVNKEKKEAIRERALMKYQEKLCSHSKSKAAKKQAEKKYALESMMKVRLDDTHTTCSLHLDLAQIISSFTVYHPCESAFKSKTTEKCFVSHWKLESDERDTIQKMKDTEREKMTEELAAWQQRQKKPIQRKSPEKNPSNAEASVVQQENKGSGG